MRQFKSKAYTSNKQHNVCMEKGPPKGEGEATLKVQHHWLEPFIPI